MTYLKKTNWIVLTLAALLLAGVSTQAQVKIGYTAAALILPELPEYKEKEEEIKAYAAQLQEQVTEKEEEIRAKMKTFEEKKGDWLPVVLKQKQAEIQRLQQDLQQMQQDFQKDLSNYESQVMEPLYGKIQEQINAVAEEGNFDLILNAYDGTGTSFLLAAPEAEEITDRVLVKLGVNPSSSTEGE